VFFPPFFRSSLTFPAPPFRLQACRKNVLPSVKDRSGQHEFFINDGIVVAQGPNYALAKRLQHWRAMLARSEGHPVSSNIAPSTATISVVHNAQFAAAYGGFPHFKPFEVAFQVRRLCWWTSSSMLWMREDDCTLVEMHVHVSPLSFRGIVIFVVGLFVCVPFASYFSYCNIRMAVSYMAAVYQTAVKPRVCLSDMGTHIMASVCSIRRQNPSCRFFIVIFFFGPLLHRIALFLPPPHCLPSHGITCLT
jgi:hypothetical protein